MLNSDADQALKFLKELAESINYTLSESDSRAKVIDPIFKECLGWSENDITREEHVHQGFIDYIFKINDRPIFVLEAKKTGASFIIPLGLRKRRYKIDGSISTDSKIKKAIDQAQNYSTEAGTKYAVVSNGTQFILFESFKHYGKWRDGYCVLFRSIEDVIENFTLFWNILSREAVISGSLKEHLSEKELPLDFKRPLDYIHNEEATSGKNILAPQLFPIINHVFSDLTDESRLQVLKKCYVRQKQVTNTNMIIKASFDRLPHYAKEFNIAQFRESDSESGEFQISFEKCREFLMSQTPTGSMIILLGGIGSGKTTFIHHFFKVVLSDREDILWFYVDFKKSHPDFNKVEEYIYDCIVQHYNNYYKAKLGEKLKEAGFDSLEPSSESILVFLTLLRYMGYAVSIVLDNVDQHSYTSPLYQERVFEMAQNLNDKFKTITLVALREESFFRSTRSGVLDAYHVPKFHIESPGFEAIMRNRVNYTLNLLKKEKEEIIKLLGPFNNWKIIELFFQIIDNSLRKTRSMGRAILRFIDEISGCDMRQALRFFNTFMTSGNTDVEEMISIEMGVPPESLPSHHYQIPLHHIVQSIILGDFRYYTSSHSNIMNVLQVNPQYTNSHFLHLKMLNYLNQRINYYIALEKGFVEIDEIVEKAEMVGINQKAIEDSLKKLAYHGLVEFDNQNKEGYDSATYVRINTTGKYYLDQLVSDFSYLDLIIGDTPISNRSIAKDLKKRLRVDYLQSKVERMQARFERTEIFLKYLKMMEDNEFTKNAEFYSSDFANVHFMDSIIETYNKRKVYITEKIS
jgi:KaiC/GvpD/RAD55 family RecA-like ATPase